jgi:hypothetical protein
MSLKGDKGLSIGLMLVDKSHCTPGDSSSGADGGARNPLVAAVGPGLRRISRPKLTLVTADT